MALNLEPVFDNMVRQFRTNASDNRFQADFVDAANNALDRLSSAADLSTAIAHVTGYSSSVSELNFNDQQMVFPIIAFELILMGRKHVRGDEAYGELKSEMLDSLGDFMVKKSREDQDDVADNLSGEDASIIGLGDRTEAVSTGSDTMSD